MEYEGQHIPSILNIKSIDLKNTKNNKQQEHISESYRNFFVDKYENISEDIFIEGSAPFIILRTKSINRPIKMLMDTGASVGIISSRFLKPDTELQNIRHKLFGLGSKGNGIISMGILQTNAIINGISLGLSLHVIDHSILGSIDGLLGFDFLINYRATIDINNLKVHFKLREISDRPKNNERTQVVEPNAKRYGDLLEEFAISLKAHEEKRMKELRRVNADVSGYLLKNGELSGKHEYPYKYTNGQESTKSNENSMDTNIIRKPADNYANYMEAVHFYKTGIEESKQLGVNPENEFTHLPQISNHKPLNERQEIGYDVGFLEQMSEAFVHTIKDERVCHTDGTWNDRNGKTESLEDRITFIRKKLKTDHCDESECSYIDRICKEFPYQFYVEGDNLGNTTVIKHEIKIIPGSKVINIKQYRIPQSQREILIDIVQDYEKQDIIEKCQSNYNSPAILVPKKDENNDKTDYRFVVDYRKLNEISEISNFPIPHIDDILDSLGGCGYFTTLDIKGAFHQILLDERSQDYTAFTVGHFQYRWKRMPMGLSEAPLTWQRAINTILADIIGKGVYIYLDDVIIYGKTFDEHNKSLKFVMKHLNEHNLQLKISKCNFYARKFEYLGFIISESGISANPKKIETIRNFPTPRDVKQVQSFLGILNYYRRFVKDFAKIAKPLTSLCKTENPFIWTMSTQKAFDTLKKVLIGDVVLKFPNFEEVFYVTTDASDVAIGAVLSQDELPNDRPIFFYSKTLSECQKRYSTIQKELLAIVEAIKAFRVYLYGRFFVLITDHKPLCYLFNMKDCNSRLFRQRIDIMEYNFKILHRAGAQNTVADALSRIKPISIQEALEIEGGKQEINTLTRAQAKRELEKAPSDGTTIEERDGTILNKRGFELIFHLIPTENEYLRNKLINKFGITNFSPQWNNFQGFHFARTISNQFSHINNINETNKCISDILEICQKKHVENIAMNVDFESIRHYIYLKQKIGEIFKNSHISIVLFLNKIIEVIEKEDIDMILELYHKSLLGGHFGADKMYKTISKFYKWNNMVNDIKTFVSKCEICQKTKVTVNTKVPMQISSLGEILFDHTYMDFVGPISPPSAEGHKYIFTATCDLTKYMIAVPTKDCSAITTADCLLENILLKYNFPSRLISDNASNFSSKIIQEITKALQIKKIFTTPYHPQSNIVERGHRTLNSYLRAFSSKNRDNWHILLRFAMFAYNNSIHTTTGFTPHELAHGFKIQIPNHLFKPKITYNYDNLAEMIRNNIANALELAKRHLYNQKLNNKQLYDRNAKDLEIRIGDRVLIKTQNKTDKFQHIYDGPYEVIDSFDEYVQIKKDNRKMKVHKNLIKKYNEDQTNYPTTGLSDSNILSSLVL